MKMKLTVPTKTIYDHCAIKHSEAEHANSMLELMECPIKSYSMARFGDHQVSVHIEFPDKSCVPYDALYEFFDSQELTCFINNAVDHLEKLVIDKPNQAARPSSCR
jgi:hypothetical protein